MPDPQLRLGSWSGAGRNEFMVTLDVSSITATPTSDGCILRLPLKVVPDEVGYGASLLALHGTLFLAETSPNHAGIAIPMQTWFPNYNYVEIPLTFADMVRADLNRQGGDVIFRLLLSALASLPHNPLQQQQQLPRQAWVTMVVRDTNGTTFTMQREPWLRLLKQGGYERARLVELPVVTGAVAPEWAECLRHMQLATNELGLGKSDAAIAECRHVLEGLVTVIAMRWGVARADREPMGAWLKRLLPILAEAWPEDKESAEVLVALYRTVWVWTSDSHHYGSPLAERDEASFAIGLAGDLVTHAGHLLQAHPEPLKAKAAEQPPTNGQQTSSPALQGGSPTP
jgi:hypothetical protein